MLADQSLPTAWAPWILRQRFWHNFQSTVLWVYLTTEIADLIWYQIYVTDENLHGTDWGKLWEELRFEHLGIQDKVESWKITSWLCIWEIIGANTCERNKTYLWGMASMFFSLVLVSFRKMDEASFLLFVWGRVLPCVSVWPQTHRDLPSFAFWILRLKVCATKPGKAMLFLR